MSVTVSRILHAGYLFDCEGTQILFDPIFENPFSKNCYAFPAVKFEAEQIGKLNLSAIFISHYHDDHCSFESLDLLNRNIPLYAYCVHDELFDLFRELGFKNIFPLKLNEPVRIGAFEIIPRRALDADVDSVFHIKARDLNVLNVVDSWIDDDVMEELAKTRWDMVLWPFQTMREIEVIAPDRAKPPEGIPHEWKEQLKRLNPRFVVPGSCQFIFESWSWLNRAYFPVSYAQFQRDVAHVVRMDPGKSFVLSEASLRPADSVPWILPEGHQNVDYDYDPEIVPQGTAEIARRFQELTPAQGALVNAFCGAGLLQKFRELGGSEDGYFRRPRTWQLSVFDHHGAASEFFYRLDNARMDRVAATKPDWITEIPAFKLYGALTEGESLSSLYLRIRGADFDIVEDPLLRCLFNGNFASYQKAQLKRLKAKRNEN